MKLRREGPGTKRLFLYVVNLKLTLLENIAIFLIMFFFFFKLWKVRNWKVCTILRVIKIIKLNFSHNDNIPIFCPILPKWMDCRMRLWLARRYHPRTVARCYQQRPTRCYQPTSRTGTMSLQIFLNSLALSPLSGVRGVCSLNSTFVGMKRTAHISFYWAHIAMLAEWWIQTQYQTAQWK